MKGFTKPIQITLNFVVNNDDDDVYDAVMIMMIVNSDFDIHVSVPCTPWGDISPRKKGQVMRMKKIRETSR